MAKNNDYAICVRRRGGAYGTDSRLNENMKNSDYVICIRRGGGAYTVYDCEGTLEANGHKHALQRFLLALGDPYRILRVVPVRGDDAVTSKADAVVFRKAMQVPYPLADELRRKQYARKSAPCEKEKKGAAA